MSKYRRPASRDDYEIAVICTLTIEADAVYAMFDEHWEGYPKIKNDSNAYTLGRIGDRNVVLIYMPGIGNANSAKVTNSFKINFPRIKLGLVVGICGGMPFIREHPLAPRDIDVFLGDIIISTEILQYDPGHQYPNDFKRIDTLENTLGRPQDEIHALLRKMRGFRGRARLQDEICAHLASISNLRVFERTKYQGVENDILYKSDYLHRHRKSTDCVCAELGGKNCQIARQSTCEELGCSSGQSVLRTRLEKIEDDAADQPNAWNKDAKAPSPLVHFGVVASGDIVVKSAGHRDMLANIDEVIGFEMEGVGVWDSTPIVVIKSVVDYADSHKSYQWQTYGAACAAACMRAFVGEWSLTEKITQLGAGPSDTHSLPKGQTGESSGATRVKSKTRSDLRNLNDDGKVTLLTEGIFCDLELKNIFKKLLKTKSPIRFIHILNFQIREFCSALRTENPSDLQNDAIGILHKYSEYFAFRICRLTNSSMVQDARQLMGGMQQLSIVGAGMVQSQETSIRETLNSDSSIAEDYIRYHTGDQSRRNTLPSSEFLDDESNASDDSDDGTDPLPQILEDTISWLTESSSFRNFKDYITRSISPPLQHVQEVLQLSSSASEIHSVTLLVNWELIEYTKSELEEGQQLSTVLVVSGDVINAEASPCLEYCRRIWPFTGEFVIRALEKAIKYGSHESTSPGIKLSFHLSAGNDSNPKEKATILVGGPREYVTGVAQQLAWLSTVFRLPSEEKFARSEFIIHQIRESEVFKLRLLRLRDIRPTSRACWHPLFLNGVLAYGFPVKARDGEVGIELPFDAMMYLAGISGPVDYKGGVVLKGYSTIVFPKPILPRTTSSDQTSSQWHLIYDRKPAPIPLSILAEEKSRALLPLKDLESLAQGRTFLGCYKQIDIHLGTKDTAYDRIGYSRANLPGRKPELSGFSYTFSLPKFGGPSASAHYTLPKRMSLTREEHCYERILSYSKTMPLILYDTSDRRAWMVPALSVILHMIHLWAFQQRKDFPRLQITKLPHAKAVWDIGREAQEVIYENSSLQLYHSKDGDKPYLLKDLVHKYWSELERVIGAKNDHRSSSDQLTGWDLMELVRSDPYGQAKAPAITEFKGNWHGLASDPNIIVLLCHGLGEVIVPNTDTQRLCELWKSVPTGRDYLTVSVECIRRWSQRFSEPDHCSKLGHTLFWQPSPDGGPFADCSHDERSRCQRAQELVKRCSHLRP